MNAMINFDFEGHAVRLVERAGEPWFVAVDVCRVLEIGKHRDAVSRLDDDERGSVVVDTLGGRQETTAVNESGLYSLILTSRKPAAKRFKKWVTAEVLPAIRRTGAYAMPGLDAEVSAAVSATMALTPREVNAWTRYIEIVARTFSREIAARQYAKTPLPPLSAPAVLSGRFGDMPPDIDGRACLRHLLTARVTGRGELTVADMLRLARNGVRAAGQALGRVGVLPDPVNWRGWVAVACSHGRLQRAFCDSVWAPDWESALMGLPGARPAPGYIVFPDRMRRAVMLPWETVEAFLSAARLPAPERAA